MTSLGTCRLVMPRSESTIASGGPVGELGVERRLDRRALGQRVRGRRRWRRGRRSGSRPAAASTSPYSAKVFGKKARTTWPKMIGSETFIIVAFRCTENSTPSALARAICAARNVAQRGHAHDRRVDDLAGEHRHRLAQHGGGRRRRRRARCAAMPASAMTADCSVERKSSAAMCATLVFESGVHAPIRCGCALA